jgi:arsenate reductase (glutaredoxin)
VLQKNGIEPEIIKYLDTPPTEKVLKTILKKMGQKPTDVIRFKEAIAKEMALKADDNRSDDEWIKLMVQHPKIIERPIVVNGDKAIMGRPPDGVLSIF